MDPFLLKALHVGGVTALFASLGAICLSDSAKKSAAALHGIALVIILLLGFAMLKKPPMDQHWWMAKLVIWLAIGAAPAFAKRKAIPGPALLGICVLLATAASWLAMTKPF